MLEGSGDSESTEEMGENPQPSVGQSAQFSAGNDIMRYDGAEIDGSAESQILGDFEYVYLVRNIPYANFLTAAKWWK